MIKTNDMRRNYCFSNQEMSKQDIQERIFNSPETEFKEFLLEYFSDRKFLGRNNSQKNGCLIEGKFFGSQKAHFHLLLIS